MTLMQANAPLRELVYGTILAARALSEQLDDCEIDFGRYRPSIAAFIDRLDRKTLFSPQDEAVLLDLTILARGQIVATYPALAETLANGRIPEARLTDDAAESARQLLAALRDYTWRRQRVLDEVLTDRLVSDLYRRR